MADPTINIDDLDLEKFDQQFQTGPASIKYPSLGNQVYELIWQRIITKQFQPGEKLSDTHLSNILGVSRTPVREALHRLAQEGIVRTLSQRGFYLATYSHKDVNEIYDLRMALEVLAVRLAMDNLTEVELQKAQREMDWINKLFETNKERAAELFLLVDRQFHKMLTQAANNQRLSTSLEGLQAQIRVFQVYGTHLIPLVQLSIGHHQKILTALINGDRLAAEKAMEIHIQEVKVRILSNFVNGCEIIMTQGM